MSLEQISREHQTCSQATGDPFRCRRKSPFFGQWPDCTFVESKHKVCLFMKDIRPLRCFENKISQQKAQTSVAGLTLQVVSF